MATYYWVGGDGTWDGANTANWSATTGGAGGSGPPNSADTVVFDSASGTGTCTTASGSACAVVTLNSATLDLTLGANHTMSGLFTLTQGSLTLGSFTLSVGRFVSSNSNARTIAFGTGNITLTGNAATIWDTSTATNFSYTGTPTVNASYSGGTGNRIIQAHRTAGGSEANAVSFNINGGTDLVAFGSTARIKSLDLTGFAGTLQNNNAVIFGDLTISTGCTIQSLNTVFQFSATSGTQNITTNGKLLDRLAFSSPGAVVQFQDALTQTSGRDFIVISGTVQLKAGVTSAVGVFSTSGTAQKFLQSTLPGAQATLSQASGTVNASNLTIRDINATGGATWNAPISAGNRDNTNNTGWNFFYRVMRPILRAVVGSIIQPVIRT